MGAKERAQRAMEAAMDAGFEEDIRTLKAKARKALQAALRATSSSDTASAAACHYTEGGGDTPDSAAAAAGGEAESDFLSKEELEVVKDKARRAMYALINESGGQEGDEGASDDEDGYDVGELQADQDEEEEEEEFEKTKERARAALDAVLLLESGDLSRTDP